MKSSKFTSSVEVSPALQAAVNQKLSGMAPLGPTARECYEAIIELVAINDGDLPSAARLVNLVNLFNAHREAEIPGVPLGSANVATECVANFRRTLLQVRQNPVEHPGLPADMASSMNRWLDRLMQTLSKRLEVSFQAQADAQAKQHQQALEETQATHLKEVAGMLHEIEGLQQEKAALESRAQGVAEERDHLKSLYEQMSQRNQDLIVLLEQKNAELRVKDRMEKDLSSQVDKLNSTTTSLRHELATVRDMLDKKADALAQALSQLSDMKEDLLDYQQALAAERRSVEDLRQRSEALQSELAKARTAAPTHPSAKRREPTLAGPGRGSPRPTGRKLSKPSSARKLVRKVG